MSIAVILRYKGKEYTFTDTFEYTHWYHSDGTIARTPFEVAEYMYTEGNYGCDCNRSTFIHDKCDESFAKMDCGRTIELVALGDVKYAYDENTGCEDRVEPPDENTPRHFVMDWSDIVGRQPTITDVRERTKEQGQ